MGRCERVGPTVGVELACWTESGSTCQQTAGTCDQTTHGNSEAQVGYAAGTYFEFILRVAPGSVSVEEI